MVASMPWLVCTVAQLELLKTQLVLLVPAVGFRTLACQLLVSSTSALTATRTVARRRCRYALPSSKFALGTLASLALLPMKPLHIGSLNAR